jgi:hypothetical protein
MMNREEAKRFAEKWLPAWSGNNPELLVSYYSENAFYLDPAVLEGLRGKANLLQYFKKLLARNPNWVWTQIEAIPMENGFLNKWLAKIPVGNHTVECIGVCTVEIQNGLITRNETYFDRTPLLKHLKP